jgi:hypothetical protein
LTNIAYREQTEVGGVVETPVVRLAPESSVAVNSGHKVDSLIEVRDASYLFELTFENKNVG